jgi:hypothetical protein
VGRGARLGQPLARAQHLDGGVAQELDLGATPAEEGVEAEEVVKEVVKEVVRSWRRRRR